MGLCVSVIGAHPRMELLCFRMCDVIVKIITVHLLLYYIILMILYVDIIIVVCIYISLMYTILKFIITIIVFKKEY